MTLENFILMNKPEPAVPSTRGMSDTQPLHQSYGMPNEMQLIKRMGHLKHEMQKRAFDL